MRPRKSSTIRPAAKSEERLSRVLGWLVADSSEVLSRMCGIRATASDRAAQSS